MVQVRFFAAAAEAAAAEEASITAPTLDDVLADLVRRYGPAFAAILARSSVLVDGVRAVPGSDVPLDGARLVDILPPFAGG